MIDVDTAENALQSSFLFCAEWRREKAIEHSADHRNIEAAEMLDRLANTVDEVKPRSLLEAYAELFEDCDGDEVERHGQLLREVGFHWDPKTATEFVQRFIAETTGG